VIPFKNYTIRERPKKGWAATERRIQHRIIGLDRPVESALSLPAWDID
jgi:hypothetical protein